MFLNIQYFLQKILLFADFFEMFNISESNMISEAAKVLCK